MSSRLLFKARHTPSLQEVRAIRHALTPILNSYTPHASIQRRIVLVLTEALTNLVKHAHPLPHFLEIRIRIDPQYLWVDLIDDGGHWNPLLHTPAPLGSAEFEESGLGIALMLSQSDRHTYTTDQNENRLSLGWDRLHRPRVLLVDDDASQRRLLTAYLQDSFDVITAVSGKDALKILQHEAISLVLSDIQMPDINGFELRQQLDQIPSSRLIPFLLLTGQDCEHYLAQASRLGVDDYLTKPVSKARLIHTLHRVLERTRQVSSRMQERLDGQITQALHWKLAPQHTHWQFASFSKNQGQGGGDFIIHQATDAHILLAIADTMGHDEGAKFFSHAFAGYLRGFIHAADAAQPPATLLEKLSHAAWQDQLFSTTTLSCCTLGLAPDGCFDVACAGHPAPWIIHSSGIRPLCISGVLPGLLDDAQYEHLHSRLSSGERIAVFTDGLLDSAPTPDKRQQLELAIKAALVDSANWPIQAALDHVAQCFDQHAGLLPKDDASLLLCEPVWPS